MEHSRIADLSTVGFVALAVLLAANRGISHGILEAFIWAPAALAPIMLAQLLSADRPHSALGAVPLHAQAQAPEPGDQGSAGGRERGVRRADADRGGRGQRARPGVLRGRGDRGAPGRCTRCGRAAREPRRLGADARRRRAARATRDRWASRSCRRAGRLGARLQHARRWTPIPTAASPRSARSAA